MFKAGFKILKKLNPKVIFEFGAFNGVDTFNYRRLFPGATIYSFEPDPILFNNAKEEMKEKNIHFYDYAISNYTGDMDFYYVRGKKDKNTTPGAGGFSKHTKRTHNVMNRLGWEVMPDTLKVKCISLKDFCQDHGVEHINYIHMDVEGAVHLVLEGMGEMRPELIYAEIEASRYFKGALPSKEYRNIFSSMGYRGVEKDGADVLFQYIN